MKKILYLLILFFGIVKIIDAQPLTADVGKKDTNYCSSTIKLGGNPTASGGTKPYTYKWSWYAKPTRISGSMNSDYATFSDSSSANPNFFGAIGMYIIKVIVTDAQSIVASDSVEFGISVFAEIVSGGVGDVNGDSVQLYSEITGGIEPLTYKWSPDTALSNPTIENPKAKPMIPNFTYTVTVTDSLGCKVTNDIIVTAIKDGNLSTGFVSFKNPVSTGGTMNFTSDLLGSSLRVFSVGGVVVYETKVQELSIPLGQVIKTTGVYFYMVTTVEGKVISGRFVRE